MVVCMDDRVKNMDDLWRESKQEFADAIVNVCLLMMIKIVGFLFGF